MTHHTRTRPHQPSFPHTQPRSSNFYDRHTFHPDYYTDSYASDTPSDPFNPYASPPSYSPQPLRRTPHILSPKLATSPILLSRDTVHALPRSAVLILPPHLHRAIVHVEDISSHPSSQGSSHRLVIAGDLRLRDVVAQLFGAQFEEWEIKLLVKVRGGWVQTGMETRIGEFGAGRGGHSGEKNVMEMKVMLGGDGGDGGDEEYDERFSGGGGVRSKKSDYRYGKYEY